MGTVYAWHTWPARGWPSSAAEERLFVEQLEQAAAGTSTRACARADITAVVTALRCGASCEQVLTFAPGLHPGRLLTAYQELDARRRQSVDAWDALVADPTMRTLAITAGPASSLIPSVVFRVAAVAARTAGAGLPVITAKMAHRINEAARIVARTEQTVAVAADPAAAARQLFDPNRSAALDLPAYLPSRVGLLSSIRVTDLLGERTAEVDDEHDPADELPPGFELTDRAAA